MKNSLLARRMGRVLVSLGLACGGVGASAAYFDSPVPASAYITKGGLDWAWAYPLPAGSGGFDLAYQSTQGWRLPTAAELAGAPLATEFMKPGGNVPLGGADPVSGATFQATNANLTGPAACATPYFSTSYRHCDWDQWSGAANRAVGGHARCVGLCRAVGGAPVRSPGAGGAGADARSGSPGSAQPGAGGRGLAATVQATLSLTGSMWRREGRVPLLRAEDARARVVAPHDPRKNARWRLSSGRGQLKK